METKYTKSIDRASENNLTLSRLFEIAARPNSLEEMLGQCLDELLEVSWLSLLPKGGVFLSDTDDHGTPFLRLIAGHNLGKNIHTLCARVEIGHCLCGRAALTKTAIHASCVDHRHDNRFKGMEPHGHYNIPIISGDVLIGVLVFYLPDGYKRDPEQLGFLSRAAGVLSLAVTLRRKEAELTHKNRELNFQKNTLDEHAIVSITDTKGHITYVNDKFCAINGFSREELIGQDHSLLNSGQHTQAFFQEFWETISAGKTWHGEIKNKRKNGTFYWVSATVVPFLGENGKPFQYVAVRTDISAQKELEGALVKAQKVANLGSWSLDFHDGALILSEQTHRIFGIDPEKFRKTRNAFLEFIYEKDLEDVKSAFQNSIEHDTPYDIEYRAVKIDSDEILWIHEICEHKRDENGKVIRSNGTVQDITERKFAQAEIERLAMTDQLTGLANRNQFNDRFDQSLKLAHRENQYLALLLLDLDKFKRVNDTYGHPVGDALLQNVAFILREHCRATDVIARLGGDEFAILLIHPTEIGNVTRVADRIIETISQPMSIQDQEIRIGASIGVSISPDNGNEREQLIRRADLALYDAKDHGRNCYRFYKLELEDDKQL